VCVCVLPLAFNLISPDKSLLTARRIRPVHPPAHHTGGGAIDVRLSSRCPARLARDSGSLFHLSWLIGGAGDRLSCLCCWRSEELRIFGSVIAREGLIRLLSTRQPACGGELDFPRLASILSRPSSGSSGAPRCFSSVEFTVGSVSVYFIL